MGEALTKRLHSILRQDIAYSDNPKNNTAAFCTRLATEASFAQGATGIGNSLECPFKNVLGRNVLHFFVLTYIYYVKGRKNKGHFVRGHF